jgi:hypothetical protein
MTPVKQFEVRKANCRSTGTKTKMRTYFETVTHDSEVKQRDGKMKRKET